MNEQILPDLAGAAMARRQLNVVFVVDASGSMSGDRMASLNYGVRAAIPAMQDAALDNPEIDVMVRVLRFSDAAEWSSPAAIPVAEFDWTDLRAGGETNLGAALDALAAALSAGAMTGRQLPAVVVLMSDGLPTDEVDAALDRFLSSDLGAKAVRIAIAIGQDADLGLLQQFIGRPTLKPLQANSAAALVNRIRWAASVPVKSVSAPVGSRGPIEAIAHGVAEENADGRDLVW